jgi:hypothetical protein
VTKSDKGSLGAGVITLKPNAPILASRCAGLLERLTSAGYRVTLEKPVEERGVGLDEVGVGLFLMVVSTVFNQDAYPRIKKDIADWFNQEPKKLKRATRVQLYDQDRNEVVEDFVLEDEEAP